MSELPEYRTSLDQSNDDIDLLQRYVQNGDQQAFAEIVDRYQSLVASVCRRRVASPADVDDAFQATFLAVIRRPRSLRQCRSLSGWLYTVACRISLRLARIRRRSRTVELPDDLPAAEPDLLSGIADAADIAAVDEELSRLPERYRNVLIMTFFAGQTSQQIADQLSESKGAVDGRIRRARHLLRVRLARRGVEFGAVAVAASLTTRHALAASPKLIRDTLRMVQRRDGEAVSPAVDLARLNSLIPLETNLMNAGILATVLTCLTFAAGAVGLRLGLPATIQVAEDAAPATDSGPLNAPLSDAVTRTGSGPTDPPTTGRRLLTIADEGNKSGAAGAENSVDVTPSQYAEFTTNHSRNAEAEIFQRLNRTVPRLDYPNEVSLSEVLEQLSEHLDIRFVPDYPKFDEGQRPLDEVMIGSIELQDVSVRSALDLILSQTREPQLDYVIWNEVVLITTREAAESIEYRMMRCYDVAELMEFAEKHSAQIATESPAFEAQAEDHGQVSGQGFFSVASQPSSETRGGSAGAGSPMPDAHSSAKILLSLIRSMGPHALPARVTPNQMAIIGPVLMARGSRRDHEQIVEVLELLEVSVRRTRGTR